MGRYWLSGCVGLVAFFIQAACLLLLLLIAEWDRDRDIKEIVTEQILSSSSLKQLAMAPYLSLPTLILVLPSPIPFWLLTFGIRATDSVCVFVDLSPIPCSPSIQFSGGLVSAIRRGRFRPLNLDLEQLMADSWSSCKEGLSSTKESNLWRSVCNLFDEMASNDFYEWRSPNHTLEVAIHRVCYPINESVLHQVFGSAGGVVEQIMVIGGTDVVMASVEFDSVEAAADAYGELRGRNIYDGCC
jgi:hypothetical protein